MINTYLGSMLEQAHKCISPAKVSVNIKKKL